MKVLVKNMNRGLMARDNGMGFECGSGEGCSRQRRAMGKMWNNCNEQQQQKRLAFQEYIFISFRARNKNITLLEFREVFHLYLLSKFKVYINFANVKFEVGPLPQKKLDPLWYRLPHSVSISGTHLY